MTRSSAVLLLFVVAVAVIILLPGHFALGITPARSTITTRSQEGQIAIVNTDAEDIHVTITAEGDLAKYITLRDTNIILSSGDDRRKVSYLIRIPSGINGTHVVFLVATANIGSDGQTVGLAIAVKHKLTIVLDDPVSADERIAAGLPSQPETPPFAQVHSESQKAVVLAEASNNTIADLPAVTLVTSRVAQEVPFTIPLHVLFLFVMTLFVFKYHRNRPH